MNVSDFDFELPDSHIALRPAQPRDSARLLDIGETLMDCHVSDLPSRLRAGDLLVLNDTRVFPAALKGIRPARAHGGGGDVQLDVNLLSGHGVDWTAFVRPAKRLRAGDRVHFGDLSADVLSRDGATVRMRFRIAAASLPDMLDRNGLMPLPPYIARRRAPDARDRDDYQTVYSDQDQARSVAAPTAGLHFTPAVFDALADRGVEITRVTLHVGAGTFLPVTTDSTDDHVMHREIGAIGASSAAALNRAKAEGRRIIAVGTTSLRTLESAVWTKGRITAQTIDTDIFITPGYEFKVVDGLMTNFHLPRSTLFMLVSALAGLDTMQRAYAHAISAGYRFYSYGDSSLIWRR